MSDVEKLKVNGDILDIADTRMRNVVGGDEYDAISGTYAVGDRCIYNNIMRECVTAVETPEAFDSEKWVNTTIDEVCSSLNQSLTQKQNRYVDNTATNTFSIPISAINQNHSYGVALVGAWKEIYLLFFVAEANNCTITKLSSTTSQTCTISNTATTITLTFSGTVWDGITIMPL